MKKTVFITGASSGIGLACARKFARNGYRLILNARRVEKLNAISDELKNQFGTEVFIIAFDVRDKESVFYQIESLPEEWQNIDILINNAGLAAGLAELHNAEIDDWEKMIDTNIKGLLYVSKAIVPGMIKRMSGHIINIGSIAGKETYMKGGVYCGTKHAVESVTRAQRMELLPYNIKVTLLNPGAVNTEFSIVRFKGDKMAAENVYKGFKPLSGEDIAECLYFCATLPDHVNVNDMLVMPAAQASATLFHRQNEQ
jgi:3-hydroxy acid dehydrogenase / malonic semialdehyde reductase